MMSITMEQVGVEYHIKNKGRVIAVLYDLSEAMQALNLLKELENEVSSEISLDKQK